MSELVKSFGELLKQFALSVDIVSEATFNRVRDYVVEYMRNELETAYFGLMTRSVIDGQPGLQTTWSSADQGSATTIRTGDGYTRQVSLCFDQRRALWVVSKDGTPLAGGARPGRLCGPVGRRHQAADVHGPGRRADADLDHAAAGAGWGGPWA